MAALSVVICDKRAKIIFARQFFNISRMDLEEYIVQFSRGVDTCKEITHFESDKVRYIFIPIDTFYLILITTKNSNIIEDTEILKLIYRLIQDLCNSITQETIISNAFEIMLGIDDIVSLGYRNSVNLGQIKQYLQMESAEEKEFKRKKEEQELAVQKALEEKGREFDRQRREKKFNKDAISSASFAFKEESIEKENTDSNENKVLNVSKKKAEDKDEEDNVEEEEKEKEEKKKMEDDERQIFNLFEENDEIESEELNKIGKMILNRIKDKLSGTDIYPDSVYDAQTQVDKLITQATSFENLAQSYLGWCPFW